MEAIDTTTVAPQPSIFTEDLHPAIDKQLDRIRTNWISLSFMAFLLVVLPCAIANTTEWIMWSAPFFIVPIVALANSRKALRPPEDTNDDYDTRVAQIARSRRYLKYVRWYLLTLIISVVVLVAAFIIYILSDGGFHR